MDRLGSALVSWHSKIENGCTVSGRWRTLVFEFFTLVSDHEHPSLLFLRFFLGYFRLRVYDKHFFYNIGNNEAHNLRNQANCYQIYIEGGWLSNIPMITKSVASTSKKAGLNKARLLSTYISLTMCSPLWSGPPGTDTAECCRGRRWEARNPSRYPPGMVWPRPPGQRSPSAGTTSPPSGRDASDTWLEDSASDSSRPGRGESFRPAARPASCLVRICPFEA